MDHDTDATDAGRNDETAATLDFLEEDTVGADDGGSQTGAGGSGEEAATGGSNGTTHWDATNAAAPTSDEKGAGGTAVLGSAPVSVPPPAETPESKRIPVRARLFLGIDWSSQSPAAAMLLPNGELRVWGVHRNPTCKPGQFCRMDSYDETTATRLFSMQVRLATKTDEYKHMPDNDPRRATLRHLIHANDMFQWLQQTIREVHMWYNQAQTEYEAAHFRIHASIESYLPRLANAQGEALKTVHMLAEAAGVLKALISQIGVWPTDINIKTIKELWCGNGGAGKKQMVDEYVRRGLPNIIDFPCCVAMGKPLEAPLNDLVDAIAIIHAAASAEGVKFPTDFGSMSVEARERWIKANFEVIEPGHVPVRAVPKTDGEKKAYSTEQLREALRKQGI